MISLLKIPISRCTAGVYLRWWYNGWHYFLFQNGYDVNMKTENVDIMTTQMFSVISKIERPTKLKAEYSYKITLEGIQSTNINGFAGLLIAEKVEQYEGGLWYEVEITRGEHPIKDEGTNGYRFDFEITRKELPYTPAVFQKSIKLYFINNRTSPASETLCDLDPDEIIPINKQTNDIAEMQDRQSDYTAQFKIRKTRAMKALFELSGEVGANTTLPYENVTCRLIQDNIEMITNGIIYIDKVDDQYYHVSILSGNLNFFKAIDGLKINDLTLSGTEHVWNIAGMAASHNFDMDYCYPLCEPSEDGGIAVLNPGVETVYMYGGWIWPFVKIKAIWDEIILNAGYICAGNILTDDIFLKMFMPISSLKIDKEYTNKYLYSAYKYGDYTILNGDLNFLQGKYYAPFTATYKIEVFILYLTFPPIYLYVNGILADELKMIGGTIAGYRYQIDYTASAGDLLFITPLYGTINSYYIIIKEISDAAIGYADTFTIYPRLHLPSMSQTDFIKMICNLFGLIPEAIPRDHKIMFWNFNELYTNIPYARDWSSYLSEREDEVEFKFGDYAQNNHLKYSNSDDVIPGNGNGIMQVDDRTLPVDKDMVDIPVSTCDEISLDPMMTGVNVSRIGFNVYNPDTDAYDQNDSIDPRIVYVKTLADVSPPIKTFVIRDTVAYPGSAQESIVNPKIAESLPVSFSYLVTNYAGLSRMLTKTNLRRAKFNLPVYEVAGLRHYIPIYLRQYKAYFYVNKINNYVPGKLCFIDLIKL